VPWDTSKYGSFHTGDSYVILNSYKKNDKTDALAHDIHIWIGKESSQGKFLFSLSLGSVPFPFRFSCKLLELTRQQQQNNTDEYGTAAYKMVEADEKIGGAAVQHREVEGHESKLFTSYFNSTLKYLAGGADSGFHHVEPSVDEPHLYQIKGTEKCMSLTQVKLSKSSLNDGDSFLLFANNEKVWVWHGRAANPDEKARANALGENMCSRGTVVTLDPENGDDNDEAFWGYLGDGTIGAAVDDDETVLEFTPLLFKLGNEPAQQVAAGEPVKMGFGKVHPKIAKSALTSDDIFLLDAGWEMFVWIGPNAALKEKTSAVAWADQYCLGDSRTADLPMALVKAGYEPTDFSAHFFE
jgi:gelsolin